MSHFFEQISHFIEEAEWASILITLLIIVLLLSFIVVNIITCIAAPSMKKSLKQIASGQAGQKSPWSGKKN